MEKQNNNLINYRSKHPRCRYCQYRKTTYIPDYVLTSISNISNCSVKKKQLYTDLEPLKEATYGWRCKCFKAVENEI